MTESQLTEKRICCNCAVAYKPVQKNQRFCSPPCRSADANRRYGKGAYSGLATGTVGAISELKVVVDLLSRGYDVFRAMSPSSSCDLAIRKNGKLLELEVRTGYRALSGKVRWAKKPTEVQYAVVAGGEILYDPPLEW